MRNLCDNCNGCEFMDSSLSTCFEVCGTPIDILANIEENRTKMNMDEIARSIVEQYIRKRNNDKNSKIDIYIVWKCKTLQNWKYLISTDIPDGMYYELTYNGDKQEWYLDAYKKMENRVIPL